MSEWKIYHNPKCSKSRAALALLRENGIEPEVIEYLKEPPSAKELAEIAKKLQLPPAEMIREKEEAFTELRLAEADDMKLLAAMASHPVLIERPIVVKDSRAVIGRPPENILELID